MDDKVRDPSIHSPTAGNLLCVSCNDAVVSDALGNGTAPTAVPSTWHPAEAAQLMLRKARVDSGSACGRVCGSRFLTGTRYPLGMLVTALGVA